MSLPAIVEIVYRHTFDVGKSKLQSKRAQQNAHLTSSVLRTSSAKVEDSALAFFWLDGWARSMQQGK
jgi:hypothetical protein